MSDGELRELERAYRATRSVDDHARWIAARLRAGRLCEHRVRLAVELGYEPARAAVARSGAVAVRPLADVVQRGFVEAERATRALVLRFELSHLEPRVAAGLFDSQEALRRLSCALAHLAVDRARPIHPRLADVVAALGAWTATPERTALLQEVDGHLELASGLDRTSWLALLPPGLEGLLDEALAAQGAEETAQADLEAALDGLEGADLFFGEDAPGGDGGAGIDEAPDGASPPDLGAPGIPAPDVGDPWRWIVEPGPRAEVARALLRTSDGAAFLALSSAADLVAHPSNEPWAALAVIQALEALLGAAQVQARVSEGLGPWILGDVS